MRTAIGKSSSSDCIFVRQHTHTESKSKPNGIRKVAMYFVWGDFVFVWCCDLCGSDFPLLLYPIPIYLIIRKVHINLSMTKTVHSFGHYRISHTQHYFSADGKRKSAFVDIDAFELKPTDDTGILSLPQMFALVYVQ